MNASQKGSGAQSCCHHEKKQSKGTDDCQASHIAFFSTTGKYFTNLNIEITKPFFNLVEFQFSPVLLPPPDTDYTVLAHNGFHPPPPNEEIRILIQSFLI